MTFHCSQSDFSKEVCYNAVPGPVEKYVGLLYTLSQGLIIPDTSLWQRSQPVLDTFFTEVMLNTLILSLP